MEGASNPILNKRESVEEIYQKKILINFLS